MYIYLAPTAGITQTLTVYPVILVLDSYPSNKVCVCVDIHRTLFLDDIFRPVRKIVKNAYDTYKI